MFIISSQICHGMLCMYDLKLQLSFVLQLEQSEYFKHE